jgi:hypothetical protein
MRYNGSMKNSCQKRLASLLVVVCLALTVTACASTDMMTATSTSALDSAPLTQQQYSDDSLPVIEEQPEDTEVSVEEEQKPLPEIPIEKDYRDSLVHGDKGPAYQKYIVLHDTEGESDPASVINWWDGNGNFVAAHFVVGKDGTIYQCVPMDKIAHHAGYGNAGHNDAFGITEDGRDDMRGSTPVGDWAPDYGMNAWSIGIEMVHVGKSGDYPKEQLDALDALIAYIDAYYGFESTITDHKAWSNGNSDTSAEFAQYLYNYQDHRTHG